MQVDKEEYKLLHQALIHWEQEGLLDAQQTEQLRATVVQKPTMRQQLAQYFFFIALCCTLLAFGALFISDKLLEKLKAYFSWGNMAIAAATALLCGAWFWYIRKKVRGIDPIAYEIYCVLGGLAALTSVVYVCKELGRYNTYTTIFLFFYVVLAVLGVLFRSRALWIGALLAFASWFCTFSTWQSHDNLFLGMNYPVRFAALGLFVLLLSGLQKRVTLLQYLQRITYIAGMVLLFVSMWGVSIFGNFNSFFGWQQVRQVHVLVYSILFAAVSAASFYLGFRYKDDLAKDFGVLFLLVNLYTRYFEYFWDALNKGLFFLILAITFGGIGWWLQRRRKQVLPLSI